MRNAPDVGSAPCPVKCALVKGGDALSVSSSGGDAEMDTTSLPGEETHA